MATDERQVERWARKGLAGGSFAEVEWRVLLESAYATQPGLLTRFRLSGWWTLIQIIVFVSPILGVAAFLSSPDLTGWRRGFDAETALVVGGACFVLAVLLAVVLIVDWVKGGRERSGGLYGAVLLTLIPAGVTLLIVGAGNSLDLASPWLLPVWVTAGLSVLLLVASVVAGRPAAKNEAKKGRGLKVPEHPVVIASLPPSEVVSLLQIRDQIMCKLEDMERFDSGAAERAREVPLGELHTLDRAASQKGSS